MPDIDALVASINRRKGADVIVRGRDVAHLWNIERIPTPSVSLNAALGGGLPRGRIVEIYGQEHTGKTSLALGLIAHVQREGGEAIYVDLESSAGPSYFERMGVDLDRLWIVRPHDGPDTIDILEALVRSGVDIVVVDSVAAMIPAEEVKRDARDQTVGRQAALMSAGLRKINAGYRNSPTTLVFLNQTREKVGAMGDPTTTPGGKALRFYASVRIELRRVGYIYETAEDAGEEEDEKKRVVGIEVAARVVKNRFGEPFRVARIPIFFSRGIDTAEEIVRLALRDRLIEASGGWFRVAGSDNPDWKFHGREALRSSIESDPRLRGYLLERLGLSSGETRRDSSPATGGEGAAEVTQQGGRKARG